MPYRISKSGGIYRIKSSGVGNHRDGRSRRKTYSTKASAKRALKRKKGIRRRRR